MTKPIRKPLFNMEMPDDVREALERVRVKLGCRSHGETVRKLIVDGDPTPDEPVPPEDWAPNTTYLPGFDTKPTEAKHTPKAAKPLARQPSANVSRAVGLGVEVQVGNPPFVSRLRPDNPKKA